MVSAFTYGAPSAWTTAVSTQLNSVASGSTMVSSDVITPNNKPFVDWEYISASQTPAAPFAIELHFLPKMSDGTYMDLIAGNSASLQDILMVVSGSSAKKCQSSRLDQPRDDYRVGIVNFTGATLPSSGNTLKYRTYDFNVG